VISRAGSAPRSAAVARATALVTLGSLLVHQLRFELAFGGAAGQALASEGHGYLAGVIPPIVAMSVAAAVAATLMRALRGSDARSVPTWHRALLYAGALLVVFTAQELAEGALAAGHPAGVAGVLGGGGWIAIPLSLAIGVVAALVARLLDHTEERIHATATVARSLRAPRSVPAPAIALPRPPLASLTLAFGLARRPPPPPPLR
jgi:hypothetical protein